MSKGKTITIILVLASIVSIIWYSMGIIGLPPLKDLWKELSDKNSITPEQLLFDITIKPSFINEGQYENGIPITLTVTNIFENNITFLSLSESDIIIDRLNKNEQTQVANWIQWDSRDRYNSNYIFYYSRSGFSGNNQLTTKGVLPGCNNCYMGENFPYEFTFIFKYQKGGGQISPHTIKKQIPIT